MEQNIQKLDESESVTLYMDDVPLTEEQIIENARGSMRSMGEDLEFVTAALGKLGGVLEDMQVFCDKTSNMFRVIKYGVEKAQELTTNVRKRVHCSVLKHGVVSRDLIAVEQLKERTRKERCSARDTSHNMTQTEEAWEAPPPHHGKREREATLSPIEAGCSKPKSKKLRVQNAMEGITSTPRKAEKEVEPASSKAKKMKKVWNRGKPEAVLIKPAEGLNYAGVLKGLKQKVSPDALGVQVKGVRQTRNGEVLVELGSTGKGRAELSAAIRDAVGDRGTVHELVPRLEVEVLDIDTTTDAEEVEAAVRGIFKDIDVGEVKVSLTKRPFRGNLRAFVELKEELAVRLVRAGHLKVGWVSCRVRNKTERMRCYRCLGFGHMAAGCEGPDRTKSCWRCGEEGHRAAACGNVPQCYLCAAKDEKNRTDHLPGSMRCLAFREAAPSRRPPGRPS